jgi:hypothetical protein
VVKLFRGFDGFIQFCLIPDVPKQQALTVKLMMAFAQYFCQSLRYFNFLAPLVPFPSAATADPPAATPPSSSFSSAASLKWKTCNHTIQH